MFEVLLILLLVALLPFIVYTTVSCATHAYLKTRYQFHREMHEDGENKKRT